MCVQETALELEAWTEVTPEGQLSVGSGGHRQGVEARSHYGIEEQSVWTQATPSSSPSPAPHHPSVRI